MTTRQHQMRAASGSPEAARIFYGRDGASRPLVKPTVSNPFSQARTDPRGATSVGNMEMDTQRFHVVLATDGDVTEREIGEMLDALGYRGVLVLDQARTDPHEHPCPSLGCLMHLRREGHFIPADADCCVCWGAGATEGSYGVESPDDQ